MFFTDEEEKIEPQSYQDKTWAKFSTLEVYAMPLGCSESKLYNMNSKTCPNQM